MRIAIFYFCYYAGTGLIIPYLALYFHTLDFTGQQVATAMSLSPIATIFIPPIWGLVADRTQRPALILQVACVGVLLSCFPLTWARSFGVCVGIMVIIAFFQSPISSLSDTVAVLEAKRIGTRYERLRLWGSIGFIVSAWTFGEFGVLAHLPWVILGVLSVSVVAACWVRQPSQPVHLAPPSIRDALQLVRQPGFLAFLIAGTIHWASCSPSYIFFPIHIKDLGLDNHFVGWAFAVGVTGEIAMMWGYRSVSKHIPLFPLLGLSFALTSLRWFVVARVDDGPTLVAIQALHAFTFGAFYVGVISYLDQTVPPSLRATGRALFTSISIGLGGLIGHQLAGFMYDTGKAQGVGGGNLAFYVAAGIEWLAPVALYLSYRWSPPAPSDRGGKAPQTLYGAAPLPTVD
jgi:MFS transporter, PPP family, 3-phenylpropionic acid transporter